MTAYELKDKIAIVTGAGSGIGHALAGLLLQAGSSVVFADLNLRPEAESTVKNHPFLPTESNKPVALFHKTDMTDWAQISDLWETTLRFFGQVDIVANIAGVYEPLSSNFWKPPGISPESKDKVDANPGQYATISINYVAPVRLAQMAIDYWCRNPQVKGNFLAVSSVAAYLHSVESPLYMSSKAALVSFVKSIGQLNDGFGIRISAVCPGAVLTPMLEDILFGTLTQANTALTSHECAEVIIRVLQEPQWGRGSIVETSKIGTEENWEISVRDIHLEALYPSSMPFSGFEKRIFEGKKQLIARLKENGMHP